MDLFVRLFTLADDPTLLTPAMQRHIVAVDRNPGSGSAAVTLAGLPGLDDDVRALLLARPRGEVPNALARRGDLTVDEFEQLARSTTPSRRVEMIAYALCNPRPAVRRAALERLPRRTTRHSRGLWPLGEGAFRYADVHHAVNARGHYHEVLAVTNQLRGLRQTGSPQRSTTELIAVLDRIAEGLLLFAADPPDDSWEKAVNDVASAVTSHIVPRADSVELRRATRHLVALFAQPIHRSPSLAFLGPQKRPNPFGDIFDGAPSRAASAAVPFERLPVQRIVGRGQLSPAEASDALRLLADQAGGREDRILLLASLAENYHGPLPELLEAVAELAPDTAR